MHPTQPKAPGTTRQPLCRVPLDCVVGHKVPARRICHAALRRVRVKTPIQSHAKHYFNAKYKYQKAIYRLTHLLTNYQLSIVYTPALLCRSCLRSQ